MVNRVYETDLAHFSKVSTLGECFDGFGTIFLAKHVKSGEMLALKVIQLDKFTEDQLHLVEEEIKYARQLRHRHVLPYYVAFVSEQTVCVVSPLMGYGSCRGLLNSHFSEGIPEHAIIYIIRDVLDGLEYIHKNGFIHRAIKASHILVSETGRAYISGLKYACPIITKGRWQKKVHSFPKNTLRNLNWLSPEMLEQNIQGYDQKSDIYSIGMTVCEMANGIEPFADTSSTLMMTEKLRGSCPYLLDYSTIPSGDDNQCQGDCDTSSTFGNRRFCDNLHEFTSMCLQREVHSRPSAVQLLSHPVFKIIKRGISLPELLKPAIPMSDRVAALNLDDVTDLNATTAEAPHLALCSYKWDF